MKIIIENFTCNQLTNLFKIMHVKNMSKQCKPFKHKKKAVPKFPVPLSIEIEEYYLPLIEISSTSKISVAFASIFGPAARSP